MKRVPVERCIAIEVLTRGEVRVEDLRPDVAIDDFRKLNAA